MQISAFSAAPLVQKSVIRLSQKCCSLCCLISGLLEGKRERVSGELDFFLLVLTFFFFFNKLCTGKNYVKINKE